MSHAFPHGNRCPLPNRILPCPMLPSLSCHCGRDTNSLSSLILPSLCFLLVIMLHSFSLNIASHHIQNYTASLIGYILPLWLSDEILATISRTLLKINNPRFQIKTFHCLSCSHSVSLYLNFPMFRRWNAICPFHVSHEAVKPKKLKIMKVSCSESCFDPHN